LREISERLLNGLFDLSQARPQPLREMQAQNELLRRFERLEIAKRQRKFSLPKRFSPHQE
jgi:hypothetical protein